MNYLLRMSGAQHTRLRTHLFPADGFESAALLLCGRRNGSDRHIFVARKLVLIPNDQCVRTSAGIEWPTHFADDLLREAMQRKLAVVKIHSHPGGYSSFSEWDDRSDTSFFRAVCDLLEDGQPHASAVMLPEGRIFARAITADGRFHRVGLVSVVGDDMSLWHADDDS